MTLACFLLIVVQSWTFVIFLAALLPLALPLAGLGCWKCNYNLLRAYRGPKTIEHGDSWTADNFPWRWAPFPATCPKCGAQILSGSSVVSELR